MQAALWIDTPALGDTIAAIPVIRKISEAHGNKPIVVFTTKPFLFENHPLVEKAFKSDAKVTFKKSHRWRYAYTKQSFKEISQRNFIQSIDKKLYALGDWCEGPSMQDAWLAGKKLAKFFKDLQLQG